MSYPPAGWPPPPPMPQDYAYGARAWNSGAWVHAPGVYPGFSRPQVYHEPREDYWATELKDNPLGLENMHIRADEAAKERDLRAQGQARADASQAYHHPRPQHGRIGEQNLVWVPALHDKERDRVRGRNSHHDQVNTIADHQDDIRASSQPPADYRNPNASGTNRFPTYPNSRDPSPAPQRQRDAYVAYPSEDPAQVQVQEHRNRYAAAHAHARPQSSTAHHDRGTPRRRSMDHEPSYGYERAYGGRTSVPVDTDERHTSVDAGAFDASSQYPPSAYRSQTLPNHRRHASAQPPRRASAVQRSQTMPVEPTYVRASTKGASHGRNGQYQYDYGYENEGGIGDEEVDDDDYVLPRTAAPAPPPKPKESSSTQRVLDWIDGARSATAEPESPRTRRTVDGYEHMRQEEARNDAYPRSRHPSSREGVGIGIARHASAPAATIASMNPVLTGTGMSDITEEPEDMSRFYRRRSPPEEDSVSSASSRSYDDIVDGPARRGHMHTPHPARARRLPERNDTLRVSDGSAHTLPSPRSLNQSSRAPSARTSYEHVRSERERERTASPSGHLSPGAAQAYYEGPASYTTPPITPTRQDYMYRHDNGRSPYPPTAHPHQADPIPIPNSNPNSAAKRGGAHERSPSFQTPARLAYLYRGSSASPSPRAPVPGAAPSSAPRSAYRESPEPTRAKGRSPRESRSPSPHIPGQASASSSYYGAISQSQQNTPSRATHAASHAAHNHSHSHRERDVDGRRRSNSRTAAVASASSTRHVRAGYWNRRGDHLTETGHIVFCPPGRNFPRDLADYPDAVFMNHLGSIVADTPDRYPELPESVPQSAGRAPERSYESFIKYVMMPG
ncbi:hypothetical protein M0805_002980 [Coniferiporia weirii]|nr:hypothetical protein M0805_002980 [Coniferiporia weirii]